MAFRTLSFFLLVVALFTSSLTWTSAQELRGGNRFQGRGLVLCWLFNCPDRDTENNNSNNDSNSENNINNEEEDDKDNNSKPEPIVERGWMTDTVSDIWCGLFRVCDDNKDDKPDPVSEIAGDIANTTDDSKPIAEAWNASKDSDTPLRDFFGELLNQEDSSEPVRDFVEEAYNRTDAPLLDFVAELFDTVQNVTAESFVNQVFNGTKPVQNYVSQWMTEDVFGNLNCTSAGPRCAYNLEGDEGVWVCRSVRNPFKLNSEPVNETLCSAPDYSFVDNDKCGSCDGIYPTPCTCSCDFQATNDGVFVTLDGSSKRQCVNKAWATSSLVSFDSFKCVTEC
ncbi:hypothetical protein FisN_2Lh477 [Fistulifera solaris]|uniref:Uncharacterized protein n=1 Tax=Fistulifera solaris TaxID=1519565 RepID=A0A1Z5JAD2_FISSO|nr:hypothetical protein FisN_2Lh477 [Fistulifera solaris]|eukprot:GAX10947.1 hypothetical protein FisN_2Lh477 [Fistulifera solaris]